jgi:hypothetical protein
MVEHRQSLILKTEGMIICCLVRAIAQHRGEIIEEYGTVIGEGKPQVLGNKPSPTSLLLTGISRCHSELKQTLRRGRPQQSYSLVFLNSE